MLSSAGPVIATYKLSKPVVAFSNAARTTVTLPVDSIVRISHPRRSGVVPIRCNGLHYYAMGEDVEANGTLNEAFD